MALLAITDLVIKLMKYVPGPIKLATIIGIGLLLASIGLESAGVIVNDELNDNIRHTRSIDSVVCFYWVGVTFHHQVT
jgi:xanthine/uracil/vitamin C permease (AzgA family)